MVEQITESEPSIDSETENQDVEAQSSSAESETEEDLLSVVQNAMETSEEEGSQPEEVEEQEEAETLEAEADASVEETDVDDDSYKDVPFNKHPRFKKLIEERNSYRESAEQYDKITSFLETNRLSAEEAAQGMQIMALMKADPTAALNALKPYVEKLSQAAGYVLPQDIQSKVDDGYLDEDVGRELAVARAQAEQARLQNEQLMQDQQLQSRRQVEHDIGTTVTEWENNTRASDPDFELKADEIDDRIRVLVAQNGNPSNATDAVAMAKRAYDEVTERYNRRFAQNKRPMRTASGGKLSGTPQAEPANLMEAVQAALLKGS
jgi:hypothetical protein